jgi:LuxR family transcriptional regulator, maltose regulon positive regulatory protein
VVTRAASVTDDTNLVTVPGRRSADPVGDPILAVKITAPRIPNWAVQRPRITELIAQGTRRGPLTVVTGPPGAGKTMALASWAATEPGTVAWVGLDEYDNRPGAFWPYVVAALRRSDVAVPRLEATRRRTAGHELVLQLATLLAALDRPVRLVLDDLHLLTEPRVLRELDVVLRKAGSGLRLAVASRMDPLLPLHCYRAAGQLAEIRAADLAFSTAEAWLLLGQHGITLTAEALESLTRRTEGWAAGLRLAAISMSAHPDPARFVTELAAQDSPLTGYLVAEVLNGQPPQARDVLLCTSILEHVSADAAAELTGQQRAAGTMTALARTNAFIQPTGSGRYRYHALFAEVPRLKLRREHPDRVAALHRRAARWYGRNGLLADAVRHAAQAGDWPLAARLVIDDLAIGKVIEPWGDPPMAGRFAGMPSGRSWTEPGPYLVSAAVALSEGRPDTCVGALNAADGLMDRVPAGQEIESRLAATIIRLTACIRRADLAAAAAATARAEALIGMIPAGKLARHPGIRARVLSGRGTVELWSGHFGEAARFLDAAAVAQAASGRDGESADVGHLALAEALRGRLGRAEHLAGRAGAALPAGRHRPPGPNPGPTALVALAWVHLEHGELAQARSCLKQADAALRADPDRLTAAVAYLAAAAGALAEGRAAVAVQIITRARSGWAVPGWLDHKLSLVESRAYTAVGDIPAALATAGRAGEDPAEAAVALAHAWVAAGDARSVRQMLTPVLAAERHEPARVRLQAWLADAHLSYASGDRARGRRSLVSALQLADQEQLRFPFAVERGWIGPVLQHDRELAAAHRSLLVPAVLRGQLPSSIRAPDQAPILAIEPLSDREREVLRHASGLLNTAEIADELRISVHTVKTHLQHIYRKLAQPVAARRSAGPASSN